ncbi:MAG TPA: CotH kinase family protein, partial [Candidatus Limnocylindria bacterium]|nr:CotH kinase family protein [Candidatus Limnocylindria bacterium]
MLCIVASEAAELRPSVTFAPRGGVFASSVTVTLSSTAQEIRYALDGSEPGTNAPLYTAPLLLTNSALLKAKAFASGTIAGSVAGEVYTLLETNVAAFTSTLPLVIINTFGQAIPSPGNAPAAWMHVINIGTNQRAMLTQPGEFAGPAKLKPRGFTSLRNPKKSYSVETLNETGEETAVPLLGMPADSDWVLYAPYADKTMIRDVLAYELSHKLGHYASRTRFVEVFLNDTTNNLAQAHYAGVYVLEEKVKVAPSRVALRKISAKDNAEPNITGGYLFKKDHLEKVGADLPTDGPARSGPPPLMGRFPTGPGGFPAAASGFQPSADLPAFANALSIVTNIGPITNFLAGVNILVPPPSVTVLRTNSIITTNLVNVTNFVVATNLLVATNFPVATNMTVTSKTVIATNPIVATQAVIGTNMMATTNSVDANTAVITTTVMIMTSATYRTNFMVSTNTVPLTNFVVITNMVVVTNSLVVTNALLTNVPVLTTNQALITNVFTLGPAEPPPGSARLVASGEGFVTSNASPFFFVEPKPAKITTAQRAWLTNYLNRFEAALYGKDFRNPTNGYAAFIDVDSFIDQHLFVEATKNIDGFRFSTFFTKDRGDKLKMEPIWDWNLS